MRNFEDGPLLRVRAIAGTNVVVLAWNTVTGEAPALDNLLGFAIERTEFAPTGEVGERYWLRGIKRFRTKDVGLPPGTPVPLSEHPLQTFQWGDYTVSPGVKYAYRVVPVTGKPKLLTLHDEMSTTVEITTEAVSGGAGVESQHDIFFNRGVIGSQAFERRFAEVKKLDASDPHSDPMVWLSRGLYEAMREFIERATGPTFGLRAAVYEFHYQPIVNAFGAAVERGADVKIVYDAESTYKVENLASIERAEPSLTGAQVMTGRTVSAGIRHNKFIVLLEDEVPVAVWTGSTNISDGGIFGHSNVGHVIWDKVVAKKYFDYWAELQANKTPTKLRAPVQELTPLPAGKPDPGVTVLFSPRDPEKDLTTLQWYADRMDEAKEIVCITIAFNLDKVFQKVIQKENDVLRYIVKDDDLDATESVGHDKDVLFAAGGRLAEGALANFRGERGNPLNRNDYIHTKFMLVDPLSKDPLVITGSANFSVPSQTVNDENMLVIRGNERVADIYFGEYMRIFDHHYARYVVRKLTTENKNDPNAGYLKETADMWLPSNFAAGSYKVKRRRYFAGS